MLFNYRHRVHRNSHCTLLCRCVCVVFISLGVAYYVLVATGTQKLSKQSPPFDSAGQESQYTYQSTHLQLSSGRKYLTYLPHSGFHNQRIAFENALVLSFALDRTLLAPPVHLADKAIRYVSFDTLVRHHEISSKMGLEHCIQVPPYISRPLECMAYFESSFVPWNWLVDLPATVQPIYLQLPNASQDWIREHFRLRDNDVFTMRDSSPYQFRFLDTDFNSSGRSHRYSQDIYLSQLQAIHHPLLQIGTLFGTSRLRLQDPVKLAFQRTVRQSMTFTNRNLSAAVESIALALGGYFLGAHIRLRDGHFKSEAERTVEFVWENLLQRVLGFSATEVYHCLENKVSGLGAIGCLEPPCHGNCSQTTQLLLASPTAEHLACRTPLHEKGSLLNTPLYVATDLRQPDSHDVLHLLRQTFPCTFFLGDFTQETWGLYSLKGPYDGVILQPFILPFIDAMVAAKALAFVGTPGSTFSQSVSNMWHSYHPL